jgi:hypothetical protein
VQNLKFALLFISLTTACTQAGSPTSTGADVGPSEAAPDSDELEAANYWEATVPEQPADGAQVTYVDHVAPILNLWCSECHLGGERYDCSGGAKCFVSFYDMMTKPGCCTPDRPFGTCEVMDPQDKTWFAHCVLHRIEATKRGDTVEVLISKGDPIILPDHEIDMIQRWIDGGLLFEEGGQPLEPPRARPSVPPPPGSTPPPR